MGLINHSLKSFDRWITLQKLKVKRQYRRKGGANDGFLTDILTQMPVVDEPKFHSYLKKE